MTPRQLIERLTDMLNEEAVPFDAELEVPNFLHLKVRFGNVLSELAMDESTHCPHSGTRWSPEGSPLERCGQCGRVIGRVVEEIKV